jgi:hypothetical protein
MSLLTEEKAPTMRKGSNMQWFLNVCYPSELFDSFGGSGLSFSMSFLNLIMNLNVRLSF